MRVITLTAKDKICFSNRICNPKNCEYADGHFDRINDAILDCIRNQTLITRATVEIYANKHKVCAFEYAMDLSVFCHVIICDYNHVYNPTSKLKRFFQDSRANDFILLHDEAHNLVDRARQMFSASISRKEYAELRNELGKEHMLYKPLGKVTRAIRKQSDNITNILRDFIETCEQDLTEDILAMYFNAMDFIRITELYDERYCTIKEPDHIKLFCLDPSYLLSVEQKKVRACVFFSATLAPLPYFRKILGGCDDDYLLLLGSPFARQNLCLVVEGRISTKYKDRELSLNAIVDRLYTLVQSKAGNYMVFFPSYAYLNKVYEKFTEMYSKVAVIRQQQGSGNDDEFLANFKEEGVLLGFAVLGGVFAEGIDLRGDRLIGVAIIGVGMPLISTETNLIKDYFNFKLAYIYPGMNKVLQAVGRLIRTEEDKGVALLIDSRYFENDYKELFPAEWNGYIRLRGGDKLEAVLKDFNTSKI